MKKDKKQKTECQITETISLREKGLLAETVYDTNSQSTSFCTSNGKDFLLKTTVEHEKILYKPIRASSPLLKDGVLSLPSKVCTDEIKLNDLFSEIELFIHRYVAVSEDYEFLASHYVLLSWVYDFFNEVPYLRVIGNPGNGKTRFLQCLGALCYKSTTIGGSTTPASILRITDQIRGTLVLDEANYSFSDMTTVIAQVLNQGYSKGFPVLRMEGKNGVFNPKSFTVFSPKIIATRSRFMDDALESRCLTEVMTGTKDRKDIPETLPPSFFEEALSLRNKLLHFRLTFTRQETMLALDQSVHARVRQIFIPLLSVSPDLGQQTRLLELAKQHSRKLTELIQDSDEYDVLLAIVKLYQNNQQPTILEIQKYAGMFDVSTRGVGEIIRKKLNLKTNRTANGYVVPLRLNQNKVTELKVRFQIKDSEHTEVNELINNKHHVKN